MSNGKGKRRKLLDYLRKTPITTLFPIALGTIALHLVFLLLTLVLNGVGGIERWASSIPALFSYLHMWMILALVSSEIWSEGIKFGGQKSWRLLLTAFIVYMVVVSSHAQLHMAVARAEDDSYLFLSGDSSPWIRYFRAFYLTFDVMGGLGTGSVVGISDLARAVIISNIIIQNFLNLFVLGEVISLAINRKEDENSKENITRITL